MVAYSTISEILREDTGEVVVPRAKWKIEVLETGLSEELGDCGGRESVVANARVRVTEPDGSAWMGLAVIEE